VAATTTYHVNVTYGVRDRASKGFRNIERSASRAAKSTSTLDSAMRRLMIAGGALVGFRTAKKWLVDYNSELESAKIAMSGLLQLNMGGEFATNQERANKLIRQFQDDAKASVATTKDFVEFAGMITGPLTRAGASMEQLRNLTKSGVVASRAMGIEAGMAALDIEQAVSGTLKSRDRFARAIIEPFLKSQGVTKDFTETWNEFVRTSPAKAVEELTRALNQPAIAQMAKAQEKSWAGMTSTLEDNIQRALGKVGLPLMQAMAAEFEKLNKWFSTNPQRVNEIAKELAESLVSAFSVAKKVMAFVVDNRRLLMTIAKAYLVGKLAGGLGNVLMQPFAMLSGTLANTNTSFLGFERGLKGVVGGLARAAGILGVVAVGASAIADYVGRRQESAIKRQTDTTYLAEHAQALAGMGGRQQEKLREVTRATAGRRGLKHDPLAYEGVYQEKQLAAMRSGQFTAGQKLLAEQTLRSARATGVIGGKPGAETINVNRMLERYSDSTRVAMRGAKSSEEMRRLVLSSYAGKASKETQWAIKAVEGLEAAMVYDRIMRERQSDKFVEAWGAEFQKGMTVWGAMLSMLVPAGVGEQAKAKQPWKQQVNAKVEIKQIVSDDPDRFAFNLIGAMDKIATHGVQAKRQMKGS
jgi:hypothetical protein